MEFIWTVVAIFSLWLLLLTFFFFRLSTHYNKLLKGTNNRNLQALLETVLKEKDMTKKDIDFLKERCDTLESNGKLHIQKIGLLRFNPFKDTGGDQSFILALVDQADSGVVISGLYSRSGTRWYAKTIKKGKGVEHELSDEEKRALQEANKHTTQ